MKVEYQAITVNAKLVEQQNKPKIIEIRTGDIDQQNFLVKPKPGQPILEFLDIHNSLHIMNQGFQQSLPPITDGGK